jgi:hypothetical protein
VLPTPQSPSLAEVVQLVTAFVAIVAVRLNQRDRRDRARPYLAIKTLNLYRPKDAPTNDPFLFNAGGGPALNVQFRVSLAVRSGAPSDPLELEGFYGQPAIMDNRLDSLWFAQILEDRLRSLGLETPFKQGTWRLHVLCTIDALYTDNGGVRYIQSMSVDARLTATVAAIGRPPVVVQLRLQSAEMLPQHRISWRVPFWTRHWQAYRRIREADKRYSRERALAIDLLPVEA